MSFLSEKGDEKHGHLSLDSYQVDRGAELIVGAHSQLDPAESLRIKYVRAMKSIFETLRDSQF
jgi:hypothetical protein